MPHQPYSIHQRIAIVIGLACCAAAWAQNDVEQPNPTPPLPTPVETRPVTQDPYSGAAQAANAPVAGSFNPARSGLSVKRNARVMIIPVTDEESTKNGMVDEWQANFVARRLKKAQADKYDLVILEIDTNGGELGAAFQINRDIANCSVPVIAYIKSRGISAGAIIALGTKAIIVAPDAMIGCAKAVTATGDNIPSGMQQKVDSDMRAWVTNLCQKNNHPTPIAVGMVNSDAEVYEIKDPTERFVTGDRLAELEKQRGGKPDIVHVWKKKDSILTLTGKEAIDVGLAVGIAADQEELFTGMNLQPAVVDTVSVTAAEKTARFLSHPLWRVLLVIVGVVGLFWEMKSPGHGVGYLAFAFCLGLFFWLQIFANNAGMWEIALFGLGALLIALEIFVLTGFGAPGFIGFALILGSIVLSFMPDGVTFSSIFGDQATTSITQWDRERAVEAMTWATITLVCIVISVVTAFIMGVRLPGISRLALNAEVGGTVNEAMPAMAGVNVPIAALGVLGKTGVAETVLKPSGKVRLEGVTYDAVTEGLHVDSGTAVTVLSQKGTTLVVRPI